MTPRHAPSRDLPTPSARWTWLGWLGMLSVGCGEPSAPLHTPLESPALEAAPYRVPDSSAGAERCAACHAGTVASWSQTGMARSLGPVALGELDGLGPVSDGDSGYQYQYARSPEDPGHVLAETHTLHGEHAFGTEVLLGIGSGELDRSYAVRYGASLRFSPLEVLPIDGTRRAALAPGHMMRSGSRFETSITNECLACHTDALPAERFPFNLLPAPEWQPRGISCAACHGSSEAHADWQESDEQHGDPIVRHTELSRLEQLAICATCHLQGDARIDLGLPAEERRHPGREFLLGRAVFVAADSGPEVGFVSHVERLTRSECFQKSEMTCSSCHDPHRSLHQEPERRRVRNACTQCHSAGMEQQSKGQLSSLGSARHCSREPATGLDERDCVSCHMPRVGTFDVADVIIHDHHIRKDTEDAPGPSSADGLRVLETKQGRLQRFTWFNDDQGPGDPGLLMMAYASARLNQEALAYLDQTPGSATADLPDYQHLRGLLLESSGRPEEAEAAYQRALELDPLAAPSATNLALLMAADGRPRAAYDLLSRTLDRFPLAEGALRNRALIAMQLGQPGMFAADLEKAFAINPSASLAQNLAKYYGSTGDSLAQSRWQLLARQLDPSLATR